MKTQLIALRIAFIFLAFGGPSVQPLFSEVNYQITYPPIVALEAGGEVSGNFFLNNEGVILWSERTVVNPGISEVRATFNTLSPSGGAYSIDNIQQIPAPVYGAPQQYDVSAFNNQGQFTVVVTTSGGARAAYLWDGSEFKPVNNPYGRDLNNPPTYAPTEPLFIWEGTTITSLADSGLFYGNVSTGNDTGPPLNVVRSGVYVWNSPLQYTKLYNLPDNAMGLTRLSGPNTLGTTLWQSISSPRKLFYNRFGTLEEILGVPSAAGGFNVVLNNKDQIFGANFVYLPIPDYGLPGGLSTFDIFYDLIPTNGDKLFRSSFDSKFEIFEDGGWQTMKLVDPDQPGFVPNIGNRIFGIDKNGSILVQDVRPVGGMNVATMMLLVRNDVIRATVTTSPTQVAVGETFEFEVAIQNVSDQPFVFSSVKADTLRATGTAIGGLVLVTDPPGINSLAPNAVFTQKYRWKSTLPGKIRFSFQAVGKFADGTENLTNTKFTDEVNVSATPSNKLPGKLTLGNLVQVADGTPRAVSATTTPTGRNVALTYNGSPYPPTGAGTYIVAGTIDDPDYQGTAGSLLIVSQNPNRLAGIGGFENQLLGASVSTPPDVVNLGAIAGWRVFNVDSANASFAATIVDTASTGSRAIRLEVNNTGGAAAYALDQWSPSMHTPVRPDAGYLVTFDASWISGQTADNLLFQVQEFDGAGSFLGNGLSALDSVSTTEYQTHTFVYRPVNPATAGVGLFFGPLRGTVGSTTIQLDDVALIEAPPLINGDFEFDPSGTSAGGNGLFVDNTFLGWRLFSVGSPPITSLTGEIVDANAYNGGSLGGKALRLEVVNTGSPAANDYGLDNDNARTPVMPGETFTLYYDAALVSVTGTLTLNVSIAEFDAAGTFTGTYGSFSPALTADQTFHRHTHEYVIANPNTTRVVTAFRPATSGTSTLVLDNVTLAPFVADTPPNLSSGVSGTGFEVVWPESHLGWRAQFNTENVADPEAWNEIPGSEAANQFSVPVSPALREVYLRLVRP